MCIETDLLNKRYNEGLPHGKSMVGVKDDSNLESPVTSTTLMSTRRICSAPWKHIRYTVSTHTQPGKHALFLCQCLELKAVYPNDIPDKPGCLLYDLVTHAKPEA